MVELLENPDTNEPNDVTPTAIALTAQGAVQVGTAKGYLATDSRNSSSTRLHPGQQRLADQAAPDGGLRAQLPPVL